ncbi:MAG TPA: zinc ribbon domain-containing protein [Clostridia bacterium]
MFCRYCGFRLDDGDKYCINCGASVEPRQGVYVAQNPDVQAYPPQQIPMSNQTSGSIVNRSADKKSGVGSTISIILSALLFLIALHSQPLAIILGIILIIYSKKARLVHSLRLSVAAIVFAIVIYLVERYTGYRISFAIRDLFWD